MGMIEVATVILDRIVTNISMFAIFKYEYYIKSSWSKVIFDQR